MYRDASKVGELKELIKDVYPQPEIVTGDAGAIEVASYPDAESVITGIVGCAGIAPHQCSALTSPTKNIPGCYVEIGVPYTA